MRFWVTHALEVGVDAAQIISPAQIVVAEWARLKCQYGCGDYGQRLTCPPYSPMPQVTRRLLGSYRQALLLRVDGVGREEEDSMCRHLGQVVAALERELFLAGFHRAWGMGAGPCPFCEKCALPAPCRFPHLARPSMEGCGIDVYSTVRQAGWEIDVVQSPEAPFRRFGLVAIG